MNKINTNYSTLFEFNPLPTWVYESNNLKIILANKAALARYGYTNEEFLNLTLLDLTAKEDIAQILTANQAIQIESENNFLGIFTHQKKSGEKFQIKLNGTNIDVNGERQMLMIGSDVSLNEGLFTTTIDVTIKSEAQKKIEESELFSRTVLETSPDCFKVLDGEGRIQFMNYNGLCQMEIDDFSTFKNKNWGSLWGIENEATIKTAIDAALKGKNTQFIAFCPTAKGTPKWWDVFVSPVGKPGEPVKKILSVSRDITNQKEKEQRLNLLESVITHTKDAILITEAEPFDEPGPKIIYVNEAFTKMTGHSSEDVISKTPRIFQGPNSDRKELARLSAAIRNLESCEITTINYKKNGEEFWVNFTVTPVADKNGWCTHWFSVQRDVTKQKQEELRLKLLESVIKNTKDAILITEAEPFDEPGPRILFVNEAFTRMTGYTAVEALGKSPRMLQNHSSDKAELAKLGRALRNWESCEITTINQKKSGELFWVNLTISPVADEKGYFTHWVSVQRDVTDQKIRELKNELLAQISIDFSSKNNLIIAANDLCKTICEFGKFDGVELWTSNLDMSRMQLFSHYAADPEDEKFYSYSREFTVFKKSEGLAGNVWAEKTQILWDDIENNVNFLRREAAKKIGLKAVLGIPLIFNNEVVGVLMIGTKKDSNYLIKYTAIFQHLEGFIGSEVNQKRLQNDLSQLFDAIPDILCLIDFDGRILKINKAGCDLIGFIEEDILHHTFDQFVHPDDKFKAFGEVLRLAQGENSFTFENRFVTNAGETIWLSWYCNTAPEEQLIYATAKNITEEKKLRELNKQVSKLAKIGSWELDVVHQKVFWTDEVHQLYETDPKTFVPTPETGIKFFREDFQELVLSNIENCIATGAPFDFEAVLVTGKKKEVWVHSIGNAEFLDGKCTRLIGSIQDITERKVAVLELEKSLKSLQDYKFSLNQSAIIAFTDNKGFITSVNNNFCQISQYSREEIIGSTHQLINSGYHPREFFKDLWLTISSGNVWRGEIKNKAKDGTYYWVYTTIVPFLNENNIPVQYLAIRFDITSRKITEEENKFKANLLSRIGQAAIATDLNGIVNYWNKAAENIYGWKKEEAIGKNIMHLTTPDSSIEQAEQIMEGLQKGQTWSGDFNVRKKDGTKFPVAIINSPIYDENNILSGIIGISSDITQDVNNKKLLQKYTSELEQSNEELEQFAYVASHDLQEPLRMIASFMDLLQRKYGDQLDEKANQYIHFATDGAKRMKQIILDLLDYSRASSPTEQKEKVDMNDMLSDFRQLRRKLISEKNATIKSTHLPIINSYKAAITQILHCLLDNALKYSTEGTSPIVEINAKENEKEWEFSIKDNGIGIDPQFYEKIFVIFQRLHNKDKYSGTGIGLSIAKRYVQFVGGRIWLESTLGEGSTFYFTIPKIINTNNE